MSFSFPGFDSAIAELHNEVVEMDLRLEQDETSPDGDAKGFHEHLKEIRENKLARFKPALEYVGQTGIGATLKHATREAWATFFPDANAIGHFRYQNYDLDSFYSHSTHKTLAAAVMDALDAGYELPDDDAPNRVMSTRRFERGNVVLNIVMALNAGQITRDEADKRFEDVVKEYGPKVR